MRRNLVALFLVVLALSVVGVCHAVPYTATYDAGHTAISASLWRQSSIVSWTFDITEVGFRPEAEAIISAEVVLNLEDDEGDRRPFDLEMALLGVGANFFFWEVDSGETTVILGSWMSLNDTGTIDCTLATLWGDFYFNSAVLNVETALNLETAGTDSASIPSPEPGTMLLLGSGLFGLAAFTRGLNKKKANKRRMNT